MAINNNMIYDLSQDLLYNDPTKPLKIISLLKIIPRFFTHQLLVKYSIPIYPEVSLRENDTEDLLFKKNKWSKIESEVVRDAKNLIQVPIDREISVVIHFVGTQIFYFLSKNYYPILTMIRILDNLVFTWQGTINLRETFEKVLNLHDIPNTEKFEIACRNFMEEFIIQYYPLLCDEEIFGLSIENGSRDEKLPVSFWIPRINLNVFGEVRIIHDYEFGIPALFKWAVFTFNDMAVQYLWDNYFLSGDRSTIINEVLEGDIGHCRVINLIVYLISKISAQETSIFFERRGTMIFRYLLGSLRWQSSFSKLLEIFYNEFQNENNVAQYMLIYILTVICSDSKDKFQSGVLKIFLNNLPVEVKIQILIESYLYLYDTLQLLYSKKDLESCKLLFEMGGPLGTDSVFLNNSEEITLFDNCILNAKFDMINKILEYSINSITAIEIFKKCIYRKRAYNLCKFLILNQKWNNLNLFVDWCLKIVSLEEISCLKLRILHIEDGKFTRKLLFGDLEINYSYQFIDKVFAWCLDSTYLIPNFKRCIVMDKECRTENNEVIQDIRIINVYAEIKTSLMNSEFLFLRKFIEWKQCPNEEKNKLKRSLQNDEEIIKLIFSERRNFPNYFCLFHVIVL